MRFLLDTHVLLWWDQGAMTLTKRVRELISDEENEIFVSAASVWEIAVKRRLKKLEFQGSVAAAISRNGFLPLDISVDDAEEAGGLEWLHPDPFDRLLVAQSIRRQWTLLTADRAIQAFGGCPTLKAR
jgi:PIN domain nuclease of toxin-antitoxin system